MKFIITKIGEHEFAIDMAVVLHIFESTKIETIDLKIPHLIGKILLAKKIFFVFDIRNNISKNHSINGKIIVINCDYKDIIHYEEKTLKYPAGFIFDNVSKIIEVTPEMIKPFSLDSKIKCINTGTLIYPMIDASKYLKEFDIEKHVPNLIELQKEIDLKEKEKNETISNKYDSIFQKNKIIDIWQKNHKN